MSPGFSMLILEDNEGDYILLKEYLLEAGLDVENVRNYTSIQSVANESPELDPGLIFLDLHLPDSQGLETFLNIHDLFPTVPIIILSGLSDTDLARQAIKAGAQDFLLKNDLDPKILIKTIDYSIQRKQSQVELEEVNRRYELLSKATNDPVWDWDLASDVIIWNEKVDIYGYPESIDKNFTWWLSCLHPDDSSRVSERLEDLIAGDAEQWSERYRFRCADGDYKYIYDRALILRDTEGRAYRMVGSMQDVSEPVRLQNQLENERALQQKALLAASIEAQEKERNQIGRDLHDNINQLLVTVKLMVTSYAEMHPDNNALLVRSAEVTNECIEEIRRLSSTLVSPKLVNTNFLEAMEELCISLRPIAHVEITLNIDPEANGKLNNEQYTAFFRIAQEQMNNIIKYAEANNVSITLALTEDQLLLSIADDGKGFDTGKNYHGIGMRNMRSRAELLDGTMSISSEPGKGATLLVEVPLYQSE